MPNFKIYTADNAPHVKGLTYGGRPFISFSVNGSFHLSPRAAQMLKVKEGQKIVFMQDTQYPSDWYVRAAKSDENGFTLETKGAGNKKALGFHSSTLADNIAATTLKESFARARYWVTLSSPGTLQLNVKQTKVTPPAAYNRFNGKPANK